MSDGKKLSDDLNEMLGDAKEGAKKAADKASEVAKEAKTKAKAKAKEFADDAKESAKEFSDSAKETLNEVSSDGKNIAIIAHITLIGWIIAFVMNNNTKSDYGAFYIRQMLGLMLVGLLLSFIPMVGWLLNLGILVLWIISLIASLSGEKKEIPLFGHLFQDWFKSI